MPEINPNVLFDWDNQKNPLFKIGDKVVFRNSEYLIDDIIVQSPYEGFWYVLSGMNSKLIHEKLLKLIP